MFISIRKRWMLLLLPFHLVQASELKVVQPYENGQWQLIGNSFECRLSQVLDGLANVSFIRQPSKSLVLQLELLNTTQPLHSAHVLARRADWQSKAAPFPEGDGENAQIDHLKATFPRQAGKLLTFLSHGYWLDFELHIGDSPLQLILPSLEGLRAIKEYEKCKAAMSPLSWEQARHYDIPFATAQQIIKSNNVLNHLRDLVRYIELDNSISKVLVDGHTDDVGSSAANRALSQVRADEVASRLREFGIDPQLLEVRAHGSRYPIVKNKDAERNLNRRVSIRLIKQIDKEEV